MTSLSHSIGRILGNRYRLVSALGTGASAHVFLAEDVSLQRAVAVKVLQPGLATDERFLRRFRAEARSVASLNHPHVLRVFDWGDDVDGPYLVMEYLGGGSLWQIMDRGYRLSLSQAVRIGTEAAQGLAYAHARGLVHRDVKPANLLFDDEGRLRISDFGVARALAESTWTEPVGSMVGTARYAAPEQAQGRRVDGRADVYSLALVLYEAVTGELPFVTDTTVGTLMARVGAELPTHPALGPRGEILPRAAAPDLAARLDAVGLAALLDALGTRLPPAEPLPLQGSGASHDDSLLDPAIWLGSEAVAEPASGASFTTRQLPRIEPDVSPVEAEPLVSSRASTSVPARSNHAELFDVEALEESARTAMFGAPVEVPVEAGAGPEPTMHVSSPVTEGAPARPLPHPVAHRARKRSRRRLWAVIGAVVVLLIGGVVVLAERGRLFTPSHPVPDVVGRPLAAAQATFARDHFRLAQTAPQYSITAPQGVILAQSPGARVSEKEGSTILVTASAGLPPVPVPSLTGLDCNAATRVLGAANLKAQCPALLAYSPTVPAGQVLNWSLHGVLNPTTARYGSTIAIAISKGPQPIPVPALPAGASYVQAQAALQAAGLVPTETERPSTTVPAGEVIGTSPAPGQLAAPGSAVTVVVSTGPPIVVVPDLRDDTVSEATAALQAIGLSVAGVFGPPHGLVFTTIPAAGDSVKVGTAISLYTSPKAASPTASPPTTPTR